jgi:MFS family permease
MPRGPSPMSAPTEPPRGMLARLRAGGVALKASNVRRYLGGSAVSTVGTYVQTFALSWLVLTISDRPVALPLTIGVQTLPILVLGPWGGSVVDRVDNRRLLVVTSLVNTALAVGLWAMAQGELVTVPVALGFALASGLVGVVERPAMQAILSELATPDEVASAVGLNSLMNPIGRLIGPPIAAVLIATVGLSWCFFVNAASFLALVAALALTRRDQMLARHRARDRRGMVRQGLHYARHDPVVGPALLMMFVIGLVGFNFPIVMPLMAKYTFHTSEAVLAVVLSVSAVGSLIGGGVATAIHEPTPRDMAVGAVVFGIVLTTVGAAPTIVWWTVFGFAVGVAGVAFPTLVVSVLQRGSRPEMLGRVLALYTVAFLGTTPLGALFVAGLASAFGARAPLVVGGVIAMVTGLVTVRYVRRLPVAGAGPLEPAAEPA